MYYPHLLVLSHVQPSAFSLTKVDSFTSLINCSILIVLLFVFLIINSTGGNLVSVHSKEESAILEQFVKYIRTNWAYFIGLIRVLARGKIFNSFFFYFK